MTWHDKDTSGVDVWPSSDADTFTIMELWWQTSRIIIPLFKSFFIQWTSSNIRLHFWRRNWEMLLVEKLNLHNIFFGVQAKAWWGILEKILLGASLMSCYGMFCISYMYSLSSWGFCGPKHQHSSECKTDCDGARHARINLTESKANIYILYIFFFNTMNAEQEVTHFQK